MLAAYAWSFSIISPAGDVRTSFILAPQASEHIDSVRWVGLTAIRFVHPPSALTDGHFYPWGLAVPHATPAAPPGVTTERDKAELVLARHELGGFFSIV